MPCASASPTTPAPIPRRRSPSGWPGNSGGPFIPASGKRSRPGTAHRMAAVAGPGACLHGCGFVHGPGGLGPAACPAAQRTSDVSIGTRLAHSSHIQRGAKRDVISRCYNLILHTALGTHFTDAQCGFKAVRHDVADQLLPLVMDNEWFFDTELLVLAEQAGLRVAEVPVDWTDDPHSSVDVVHTAAGDLRGVGRLIVSLGTGRIPIAQVRHELSRIPPQAGARSLFSQLVRFAAIGAASTLAYVLIFWIARQYSGAQVGKLRGLADNRHRQHRRQPFLHLWHPGQRRRRHPSPARADRFRPGVVADRWIALCPQCLDQPDSPLRSWLCWWQPTCWPRCCDSSCSAIGCSRAATVARRPRTGRRRIRKTMSEQGSGR